MRCSARTQGVEMPGNPKEDNAPDESAEPVVGSGITETNDVQAEACGQKDVTAPWPLVGHEVLAEPDLINQDVISDTAVESASVTEPNATEPHSAVATIRLEKKHPLAIRWMHWVNFPVLFTMIWSGLLIYWNDSDNAYQHPHAVYRIGIGSLTLARMFPPWFWKAINAPYRVTEGLGYHFFFMWVFAINGILYVAYLLISGEWRVLVPERRSIKDAIQVTLVDLHLRKGLPPQKKYNGAQRIAYSAVILMGLGSLVTGLSIYKPTQVHWVTTS